MHMLITTVMNLFLVTLCHLVSKNDFRHIGNAAGSKGVQSTSPVFYHFIQ